MKILFAVNPIGLGHAARDVSLIPYLNNHRFEVTFLTGGISAVDFLGSYGHRVLNILRPPEFPVSKKGILKNSTLWMIRYIRYYEKSKKLIAKQVDFNVYDGIISDEEFATVSLVRQRNKPYVIITDIIGSKFAQNPVSRYIEKRTNKWFYELFDSSPLVIIPEFGESHGSYRYTGAFVREIEETRDQLREKFGFHKKIVLITTGGLKAGFFLLRKVANAIPKILEKVDKEEIEFIAAAPHIQTIGGKKRHIKFIGFQRDLHKLIYASDLVITLAGKTTMDECKVYGTPFIAIPIKGHFEQEENAREEGYIYEDINRLDELILSKISIERMPRVKNNAEKAANLIKDFFDKNKEFYWESN